MLRQVYVYRSKVPLYKRHFGKALKEETLNSIVNEIRDHALTTTGNKVGTHEYFKYKISFISESSLDLIFLFVTGLTDSDRDIEKEIIKCKREFLNLFGDIINRKFDEKTFEVFDPTIDSIHRNLRPKISLVGFSGVGKTTITRLIKSEEIPMQHVPTITGDIATIKIGKLHFHLWDFAGQEQFSYLWNNFIKGSDAVLLITDSSLENVEKSKFFLELIKEEAKDAHTAVIGNKQDLSQALKPEQIENILGLKTYSMIATDPGNRDKMIQIIADILEMNAEVSPLLRPLLERDKITEEAQNALENGEFRKAASLFERISDFCLELGDHSLGKEFYEKSMKIKNMLQTIDIDEAPAIETPKKTPPSQRIEEPQEIIESGIKEKTLKKEIEEELVTRIETTASEAIDSAIGIDLKTEDFMIKERPKTVTFVPNDAKKKLKTSAYGHVENTPIPEKKRIAVSPTELFRSKPSESLTKPKKSVIPIQGTIQETSIKHSKVSKQVIREEEGAIQPKTSTLSTQAEASTLDSTQRAELQKSLLDLKIKKANLSKMSLDFDMKELMGEITLEELKEKKERLTAMENSIDNQIKELELLLKN